MGGRGRLGGDEEREVEVGVEGFAESGGVEDVWCVLGFALLFGWLGGGSGGEGGLGFVYDGYGEGERHHCEGLVVV